MTLPEDLLGVKVIAKPSVPQKSGENEDDELISNSSCRQ